jgi:hemerythrin-like domain-containing protein
MKPIGPMMVEHRLIERIVPVLKKEIDLIDRENRANQEVIMGAVDFFRVYADRLHHGKEENILFREMKKKEISEDDRKMMAELEGDHAAARENVGALHRAAWDYARGDAGQLGEIRRRLTTLAGLYPPHIKTEDNVFFPNAMKYFSVEEQEAMFREGEEFDKRLIHERYKQAMEGWEAM